MERRCRNPLEFSSTSGWGALSFVSFLLVLQCLCGNVAGAGVSRGDCAFASPRHGVCARLEFGSHCGWKHRDRSPCSSAFLGRQMTLLPPTAPPASSARGSRNGRGGGMSMFLGQDSGILGVGAPEIVSLLHFCTFPRDCGFSLAIFHTHVRVSNLFPILIVITLINVVK